MSESFEPFDAMLDSCWQRLQEGVDLESCLQAYPEHEAALRPLLVMAVQLRQLPPPPIRPAAQARGKAQMLAALDAANDAPMMAGGIAPVPATLPISSRLQSWWRARWPRRGTFTPAHSRMLLRVGIALFIVAFFSSLWVTDLAASSLPGDPLYSVKRSWEEVRLNMALSPESVQELKAAYNEERIFEIEALMRLKRPQLVMFEGIVENITDLRWIVAGLPVDINQQSEILGPPLLGATAIVNAQVNADGSLLGLHINVLEHSLRTPALDQSLPPTRVAPHSTTVIEVEVRAPSEDPTARSVVATPVPAPTTVVPPLATGATSPPDAQPQLPPTSMPIQLSPPPPPPPPATMTATATQLATATATATPWPTGTETLPPPPPPSATSCPGGSCNPTPTPQPTVVDPTATPLPTTTPLPTAPPPPFTATPWPTFTPLPTMTPWPTPTATQPLPTATPRPPATPTPPCHPPHCGPHPSPTPPYPPPPTATPFTCEPPHCWPPPPCEPPHCWPPPPCEPPHCWPPPPCEPPHCWPWPEPTWPPPPEPTWPSTPGD